MFLTTASVRTAYENGALVHVQNMSVAWDTTDSQWVFNYDQRRALSAGNKFNSLESRMCLRRRGIKFCRRPRGAL